MNFKLSFANSHHFLLSHYRHIYTSHGLNTLRSAKFWSHCVASYLYCLINFIAIEKFVNLAAFRFWLVFSILIQKKYKKNWTQPVCGAGLWVCSVLKPPLSTWIYFNPSRDKYPTSARWKFGNGTFRDVTFSPLERGGFFIFLISILATLWRVNGFS